MGIRWLARPGLYSVGYSYGFPGALVRRYGASHMCRSIALSGGDFRGVDSCCRRYRLAADSQFRLVSREESEVIDGNRGEPK